MKPSSSRPALRPHRPVPPLRVDWARREVAALLLAVNLLPLSARASREDVHRVLSDVVWDDEPFFSRADFRRLDESDDAGFYATPRLVYHIDDAAVKATTTFYTQLFAEVSRRRNLTALDALDLCSSWVSHYPEESMRPCPLRRVAGLGMNADELRRNTVLSEWTTRDLNLDATLPYAAESFDVVTCTVSIDYLTNPLEVVAETARILRPGGTLAIVFSNRLFFSKAVAIWTGKDDLEHIYTVGAYIHFGGKNLLSDPRAIDLTPSRTSRQKGDPLYAVVATKL
mmetsp:Transcript_6990/g.17478  ORF Transcript_6990/g.17478 Transcript_6990/m.17478 type:complete len:284 (-) Transcript_6990:187-1038(-)